MSISSLTEPRAPAVARPLAPNPLDRPAAVDAKNGADGPSPFAQLLKSLGREVETGEGVVRGALAAKGGTTDPGELIALQAGVYRYSEAVDLTAKLVDHATSGIKTIVQGQ